MAENNCCGELSGLTGNPLGLTSIVDDDCPCANDLGYVLTEEPESTSNAGLNGCCVISVNSKNGVVVLTTSDIAEGTNLYFNNTRAREAISGTSPILYSSQTGIISHKALIQAGTYGDATHFCIIQVDAHGHVVKLQTVAVPTGGGSFNADTVFGAGKGFLVRTATGWAYRTISGTAGVITVSNSDGQSGNSAVSLATIPGLAAGTHGSAQLIPVIQVDTYGRVVAISTIPIAAPTVVQGDLIVDVVTSGPSGIIDYVITEGQLLGKILIVPDEDCQPFCGFPSSTQALIPNDTDTTRLAGVPIVWSTIDQFAATGDVTVRVSGVGNNATIYFTKHKIIE